MENFINTDDDKGRDYICSAEGASNFIVNLSGKRTLVWRSSGECSFKKRGWKLVLYL